MPSLFRQLSSSIPQRINSSANLSMFKKALAVCLADIPLASFSIALLVISLQLGITSWGDAVIFKGFTARILGIGIEEALLSAIIYIFYAATLLFVSSVINAFGICLERHFSFFAAINASFSLFLLLWSASIFVSSSTSLEPSPSLVFGLSISLALVALVAVYRFRLRRE